MNVGRQATLRVRSVAGRFLGVAVLWIVPITSVLGDEYDDRISQIRQLLEQCRFSEAEAKSRELVDWVDHSAEGSVYGDYPALAREHLAQCLRLRAKFDHLPAKYDEAERLCAEILSIWARLVAAGGSQRDYCKISMARSLLLSAEILRARGRVNQAESRLVEALETLQSVPDIRSLPQQATERDRKKAEVLQQLAGLYEVLNRFAEADLYLRRAVEIADRVYAPAMPVRVNCYHLLGNLCRRQGRLPEAEKHFLTAMEASKHLRSKTDPGYLARSCSALAVLYYDMWHEHGCRASDRWKQAERYGLQALEGFRKAEPPNRLMEATTLANLGRFYRDHGYFYPATRDEHYRKAKDCCHKALAILQREPIEYPGQLVLVLYNLALLDYDLGRYDAAQNHLDAAVAIMDGSALVPLDCCYNCHYLRAKVAWAQGRRDVAMDELDEAKRLSLRLRALGSGSPYDRARYFTLLANPFERSVKWHCELAHENPEHAPNHVKAAYRAMEQGRALSLFDQIESQGVDLLEGVAEPEAARIRHKMQEIRATIVKLETELAQQVNHPTGQASSKKLQLDNKRDELQQVYRRIWDISPACRAAVGNPHQVLPFEQLRNWAAENKAVILEYLLGADGGYLLAIPGSEQLPLLEKIDFGPRQSSVLEVEPGPVTANRLHQALTNSRQSGVLDRIARGQTPAQKLFALWQALVPQRVRDLLLDRSLSGAVIIPDGPLALLPFDALVVDRDSGLTYLLDCQAAPPVVYAPSATLLVNLAKRPAPSTPAHEKPVLSVAKNNYQDHRHRTPPEITGGIPFDLEFAREESDRVRDQFGAAAVEQLVDSEATEENLRRYAPRRLILHIVCHSWYQEQYGNMFGAMALSIPPSPTIDPANDGCLTLLESYELDLRHCELIILSGCHSAFGPVQRSEAVWAISRGYLVAGAKRVVAAAWDLHDEATADLVSAFCQSIQMNRQSGKPRYAQALRRAKRLLRSDPTGQGWDAPYYWAPLIQTGLP